MPPVAARFRSVSTHWWDVLLDSNSAYQKRHFGEYFSPPLAFSEPSMLYDSELNGKLAEGGYSTILKLSWIVFRAFLSLLVTLLSQVEAEGRRQFLSAVCMGCLEGWNITLKCLYCGSPWDGSSLILGTMYSFDIFAAMPCCRERLQVRGAATPLSLWRSVVTSFSTVPSLGFYHFLSSLHLVLTASSILLNPLVAVSFLFEKMLNFQISRPNRKFSRQI